MMGLALARVDEVEHYSGDALAVHIEYPYGVPELRRALVAPLQTFKFLAFGEEEHLWSAKVHAAFAAKPYSWCKPPTIEWATTLDGLEYGDAALVVGQEGWVADPGFPARC